MRSRPSRESTSFLATAFRLLPLLLVAACVSRPAGPSEGFVFGGERVWLASKEVDALRRQWSGDVSAQLAGTQVSLGDRYWVLDFIALFNGRAPSNCHRFELLRLERHPLGPVSVLEGASSQVTTIRPQHYHEAWFVRACDVPQEWRILDDPDDKRYLPVTPILWKRG
jgi:hypothetical protein